MMSRALVLTCVFVAALAAACKGPIEITVAGSEDMNERNAATVVLYQLSGDASFLNASLDAFWRDDVAALGPELVPGTRQRLVLYPGESRTVEIEPLETTRFVGFAADLRNPDPRGWRRIHPVSEIKGKKVGVTVMRDRLHTQVD